jgi:hypothetical protein
MMDENRTVIKITGDGKCLNKCVAFSVFGDELYPDMWKLPAGKLSTLIKDNQWKNKWTLDSWTTQESQEMLGNNSDAMLVHSLGKFYGPKLTETTSIIFEGIKCHTNKI